MVLYLLGWWASSEIPLKMFIITRYIEEELCCSLAVEPALNLVVRFKLTV